MSITTKTGDDGTTGLLFNRRVLKDHPRIEAYSTCDEFNTVLGMGRALVAQGPSSPKKRGLVSNCIKFRRIEVDV